MTESHVKAMCRNFGVLDITGGRARSQGSLSMWRKRNQHCATHSSLTPSGSMSGSSSPVGFKLPAFNRHIASKVSNVSISLTKLMFDMTLCEY